MGDDTRLGRGGVSYDSLIEEAEQETRLALWLQGNASPSEAAVRKGGRKRVLEMLRQERRRNRAEAEHAYMVHDLRVPFVDDRRPWNVARTPTQRREEARRRRADPAKRERQNAHNRAYRQRQREAA